MNSIRKQILTINGGSSSIKCALFDWPPVPKSGSLQRILTGEIANIGMANARLSIYDEDGNRCAHQSVVAPDQMAAAEILVNEVQRRVGDESLIGIGHRVVHGGPRYHQPEPITPELIETLHELVPFDPVHLPGELRLIEVCSKTFFQTPQYACFDTAFHHDLPRIAQLLAIPVKFYAHGVRRYGFHGLSYEYLMSEVTRIAGAEAAQGRIVLAHLGNGASLAAVQNGKPVDTTMGFTPCGGVPMGTRSGDLDPGVISYLATAEKMNLEEVISLTNYQSGLLGLSATSSDVRALLELEIEDARAADALSVFCYAIKKQIGAFAAALGGIETLVFSGGIGENSPVIRQRICAKLEFLGIQLENSRNLENEGVISTEQSRVSVRVIRTDEEQMIAESVARLSTK